jgi:hypothetical protein
MWNHDARHGREVGAATPEEYDASARATIRSDARCVYRERNGVPRIGYYHRAAHRAGPVRAAYHDASERYVTGLRESAYAPKNGRQGHARGHPIRERAYGATGTAVPGARRRAVWSAPPDERARCDANGLRGDERVRLPAGRARTSSGQAGTMRPGWMPVRPGRRPSPSSTGWVTTNTERRSPTRGDVPTSLGQHRPRVPRRASVARADFARPSRHARPTEAAQFGSPARRRNRSTWAARPACWGSARSASCSRTRSAARRARSTSAASSSVATFSSGKPLWRTPK